MNTRRRALWGWCMYDFASSSFATLTVTFIYAAYFTRAIAPDPVAGTALWSRAIALSALAVALLSPLLGALADGGRRKRFLFASTALCVASSILLYGARPGQVERALFWFVLANIAFELSNVFYNAFLPELAPPEKIGRISGYGWGLGYVGGLLAMGLALVCLIDAPTPWLGFEREAGENIRAVNLLVAIWFALFSLPLFGWVREEKAQGLAVRASPGQTLRRLAGTFAAVKEYREIIKLLAARLFYNDGLITVFAFAGIFAAGTFGFSFEEIMIFGIAANIAAGFGAFAFGFLDDFLGGKRTLQISLVLLLLAALLALLAPNRLLFWIGSMLVGLCAGPNQSASRSLMGRFVPPARESEFYGLFAFSGKATAFAGPFLLGELTRLSGSQRAGMGVVVAFFALGLLLLHFVDEEGGEKAAGRATSA